LILESGDYILKLQRDVVDPVKITFKDGYAKKIEGGFTAKLLQRWFDRWEDPEVYGVAHVGWGTHKEGAVWTDSLYFCVADAESYPGVMQIGVGATSDRPSLGHCDIECRHCNIYLDNELIVKDGEIVNPQCS
jgi:2,5-dihydroxypyridine 5,6-dioxygenase